MANPRKRKAIKDGRMEQMIKEKNKAKIVKKEVVIVSETKVEAPKDTKPPMDPFIAKEIEEIERIPSNKKKTTTRKKTTKAATKKKTTTRKRTTLKKKTGDK
jgi:hypothetical protein